MKTVVLITSGYPYGAVTERGFVEPDIEALAAEFDRVVVMPLVSKRGEARSAWPANTTLSRHWLRRNTPAGRLLRLRHLFSPAFRRLTRGRRRDAATLKYALAAIDFAAAFSTFMRREGLDASDTLVYSFWLEYATAGLALLTESLPGLRYVSRSHNYDVYTPVAPAARALALRRAAAVFDVSEAGRHFLRERFGSDAARVECATLGSVKAFPEALNPPAERGGSLEILSCSRVEAVKRVDLNFEMLSQLAEERPDLTIRWTHIGDGSLMDSLKARVAGSPPNLVVTLEGEMANRDVQQLYTRRHFDAFILLSSAEGLPIALCEAMSYGVPVIAADAGGSREIADDGVGALLPADFTYADFRDALLRVAADPALREGAAARWRERFDARTTRPAFAKRLKSLLP